MENNTLVFTGETVEDLKRFLAGRLDAVRRGEVVFAQGDEGRFAAEWAYSEAIAYLEGLDSSYSLFFGSGSMCISDKIYRDLRADAAAHREARAVYLHVLREVAHRAPASLLEELSTPVRALLKAVRDDGSTNGIRAFDKAGGEKHDD